MADLFTSMKILKFTDLELKGVADGQNPKSQTG